MTEQNESNRTVVGKIVSDKMNKTIVVQVERKIKHPLYGKYIKRSSKMYAHDSENLGKLGDVVLISNSRPISKTKHWVLIKVIDRAESDQTDQNS